MGLTVDLFVFSLLNETVLYIASLYLYLVEYRCVNDSSIGKHVFTAAVQLVVEL